MNINVTSGSGNKVDGIAVATAFSPLYVGPVVDSDGLVFKQWKATCREIRFTGSWGT